MPLTRLTPEQVAAARTAAAAGKPVAPYAKAWGVSAAAVRHAVRGTSWAAVADPPPVPPLSDPAERRRRLTAEQVSKARRLVAAGTETITSLAASFDCSYQVVESAVRGRTWGRLADPPPVPVSEPGPTPANIKLNARKVASARRRYLAGASAAGIAAGYGVSLSAILSAIHGRSWAGVTDPPPVPVGEAGLEPVMGQEDVEQARSMRAAGSSFQEIAERFGVARSTVHRTLGRARQHS